MIRNLKCQSGDGEGWREVLKAGLEAGHHRISQKAAWDLLESRHQCGALWPAVGDNREMAHIRKHPMEWGKYYFVMHGFLSRMVENRGAVKRRLAGPGETGFKSQLHHLFAGRPWESHELPGPVFPHWKRKETDNTSWGCEDYWGNRRGTRRGGHHVCAYTIYRHRYVDAGPG